MGNNKSSQKGHDLAVGSYALGETAQRASGVVNGPDGKILVSHSTRIVSVDPKTGEVSNYAGKHHVGGYADGHRTEGALFQKCSDLAIINQAVYVVDCDNCRIRVIQNDAVSTFAGTGKQFIQDGPRMEASFFYPQSIAVLASFMYITDLGAGLIRIISPEGIVSTLRNSPGESMWRWRLPESSKTSNSTLSTSQGSNQGNQGGGGNNLGEKSPFKDTSGSTPQKSLSTSSSEAFEGPHEFDEDSEGKLKFGILKDVTAGLVSGTRKVFYVADEVKATEHSTGAVVNVSRVMRFDVEKREVEAIVLSKAKPTNPPSSSPSSSRLPSTVSITLTGGREISKEGPNVSGLCAVSLNSSHDSCLLISDPSKHSIWRAHIKHSGSVSMANVVGKEGGFKDGSLKSAKLSAPDSLFISPSTGDLYWIDGTLESPDGKLREVKAFEKSVQTMYRAEVGANVSGSSTPTTSGTPNKLNTSGGKKNASSAGSETPTKSPLFSSQPASKTTSSSINQMETSTTHQNVQNGQNGTSSLSTPSKSSSAIPSSPSTPPNGVLTPTPSSGAPASSKAIPIGSKGKEGDEEEEKGNRESTKRLSASAPNGPPSSSTLSMTSKTIAEDHEPRDAHGSPHTQNNTSLASTPSSTPHVSASASGGAQSLDPSVLSPLLHSTSPRHFPTPESPSTLSNGSPKDGMHGYGQYVTHAGPLTGQDASHSPHLFPSTSDPSLAHSLHPSSSTWKTGSSSNTIHWRNLSGATPPPSESISSNAPSGHHSGPHSGTRSTSPMQPSSSSSSLSSNPSSNVVGPSTPAKSNISSSITVSSSVVPPLATSMHNTSPSSVQSPGRTWMAASGQLTPSSSQNNLSISSSPHHPPSSPTVTSAVDSERLAIHRSARSVEPSSKAKEKESVPLSQGFVFVGEQPSPTPKDSSYPSTVMAARLLNQPQQPHSAPAASPGHGKAGSEDGALLASSSSLLSSSAHLLSSAPSSEATHSTNSSTHHHVQTAPSSTSSAPPLLYSPSSSANNTLHADEAPKTINFTIATSMPGATTSPASPWAVSIPPDFADQPNPALYDDWTVISDSATSSPTPTQ